MGWSSREKPMTATLRITTAHAQNVTKASWLPWRPTMVRPRNAASSSAGTIDSEACMGPNRRNDSCSVNAETSTSTVRNTSVTAPQRRQLGMWVSPNSTAQVGSSSAGGRGRDRWAPRRRCRQGPRCGGAAGRGRGVGHVGARSPEPELHGWATSARGASRRPSTASIAATATSIWLSSGSSVVIDWTAFPGTDSARPNHECRCLPAKRITS